jgi:hypothetical protein
MSYQRNSNRDVPFQSGCDDQPGPNQFQQALHDLHEIYSDYLDLESNTSATTAAKRKDDRAKANMLRNASLGMLSPNDRSFLRTARTTESSSPISTSNGKTTPLMVTPGDHNAGGADFASSNKKPRRSEHQSVLATTSTMTNSALINAANEYRQKN